MLPIHIIMESVIKWSPKLAILEKQRFVYICQVMLLVVTIISTTTTMIIIIKKCSTTCASVSDKKQWTIDIKFRFFY